MRIEATIDVEATNEDGDFAGECLKAVVGDVTFNADGEASVAFVTDVSWWSARETDRAWWALCEEAERKLAAQQRARALVEDFFTTGVMLAKAVR